MEASETWSIGEQFDMIHPFFHGKWWFYVEFLSIWGFKMIDIFQSMVHTDSLCEMCLRNKVL